MINTVLCDKKWVPGNQTTVAACNFTQKTTFKWVTRCVAFHSILIFIVFYKTTKQSDTVAIIPVLIHSRE